MIFPDAVFSTFSLSPYDFPIVDAAIGIGLATILLYILSYLIAIVVRGDRLRLLFLTTLTLAFFVGPRLMEFFNLAAPTKIVEPVASVMGVNTATVNQLLLLLPLYFVLLCLQFTFTKRYRCDDRDCRAPAMYEHAKYCWKCQKERAVEDASPAPSLPRAKSLPGPTIG